MRLLLIVGFILAFAGVAANSAGAAAKERQAIRIGYVASLTGPNAYGANVTVVAEYRMWVADVNQAGGILLSSIGRRLPIEVIVYDDESNAAGAIRGTQRLIEEDQVDFVLAPWGTGLNLAVAPLLNAAGYPHIVSAAIASGSEELAKRWPNTVWLLNTANETVQGLIQVLTQLRTAGKIGDRVAIMFVADQFGIDLQKTARAEFKKAKFDLVYDRAYAVGSTDLRPALAEIRQADPDAFIAFSYPPDTMLLVQQSIALNFNPKVFFTSVGTAYPMFRDHFGRDAEGVMGIGGWDGNLPESKLYLSHHIAMMGQEPDRWGSPVTYAGLQMLQQAIEHVGGLDRAAVTKELQTGTFETVIGPVQLENQFRRDAFGVGQWQQGEFQGVAPTNLAGARAIEFPKPAWTTLPAASQ